MPNSGRLGDDRGASAVEFALILPLFLVLVLGMVDFARAYNVQLTLTEAAREGVRPLALREPGADATSATRAAIPAGSAINATDVTVASTSCPGGALSVPAPNATVVATYSFGFITPGLGALANLAMNGSGSSLGAPLTLTGRGVMRCSG